MYVPMLLLLWPVHFYVSMLLGQGRLGGGTDGGERVHVAAGVLQGADGGGGLCKGRAQPAAG